MVLNKKAKGTNAERDLIHLLWENGWAAMRTAGSGSIKYPAPDVLAGNGTRKIAIECKVTAGVRQYLTKKEIAELQEFSSKFGAESWIGVKFNNVNWYFLMLEDLHETENNYRISIEMAKRKGLSFEQMIKGF